MTEEEKLQQALLEDLVRKTKAAEYWIDVLGDTLVDFIERFGELEGRLEKLEAAPQVHTQVAQPAVSRRLTPKEMAEQIRLAKEQVKQNHQTVTVSLGRAVQ